MKSDNKDYFPSYSTPADIAPMCEIRTNQQCDKPPLYAHGSYIRYLTILIQLTQEVHCLEE